MSGEIVRATEPALEHGAWVQVYIDPIEGGPGYVRIEEQGGIPGVAILPLAPGRIGLVEVFRYPLGQVCREIPRGFGEGSDPRLDAVRELREETGLVIAPDRLVPLGSMHPNSGLLASEVSLFAAPFDSPVAARPEDEDEVTDFSWVPTATVLDAIRRDELRDGFTQVALLRAQLAGLIRDN